MADIPSSVGWFTVTGRHLLGLADSDDVGSPPDAVASVADVLVTNNAPNPIVAVSEDVMFSVDTVRATLDSEGRLRPPADGLSGEASASSTEMRLIAPDQAGISDVGWTYTFTFVPRPGQSWSQFAIEVTGAPGETRSLAAEVLAGHVTSLTAQPFVHIQEGTDLPEGIFPGQFLLDTDTNTLYIYR